MERTEIHIKPEADSPTKTYHKREEIEDALRKDLHFLRFKNELERNFLDHYFKHSLNQARVSVLLGLFLYAAYGLLDYLMFPDVKTKLWIIRYGIVSPTILLVFFTLFFIKSERLLQVSQSFAIITAGIGVVVFIKIIPDNLSHLYYAGIMLTILYGYVVLPIRLRYAVLNGLIITSVYIGMTGINTYQKPVLVNNIFGLTTANIVGIFACYLLEKYKRKEYLQLCLLNLDKEKLRELSFVDGLTNIANRRAFNEFFLMEWNRALRFGHTLAMLLIDVDHFKLYNDAMGHQAGDECLRRIAEVLSSYQRRPGDFVARYGGEEFTLILSGASPEYAVEVAESIRLRVRDLQIPHPASNIDSNVTISIGVALCTPAREIDREALVRMADNAMYQAKQGGRNRVVFLQQ
jgi:diguanylate cyclase (GGDEF)-like protein